VQSDGGPYTADHTLRNYDLRPSLAGGIRLKRVPG